MSITGLVPCAKTPSGLCYSCNIRVSGAWQTFKIENIAIPSNLNNLAVVIWTDDGTQVSGAEWDLAQVQLEAGSAVTDFEYRSVGEEMLLCKRYYATLLMNDILGLCAGTTDAQAVVSFTTPMRVAPGLAATSQAVTVYDGAGNITQPTAGLNSGGSSSSVNSAIISFNSFTTLTASRPIHGTNNPVVVATISAEL